MSTLRQLFLMGLAWVFAAAAAGAAEQAWELPLKADASGQILVDQQDRPFLVNGDTAWSLIVQLTESDIERYLDDRRRRGFNSIIVNLIEHKFCSRPPQTRAGLAPFDRLSEFAEPNPAYFDWAHQVVEKAHRRGMVVWLAPAYLGYGGGDEGFFKEIKAGGEANLRSYGRWIGERFRDLPNVVWMVGGDFTPPPEDRWTVTELAAGIGERDQTHPMMVHTAPEHAASEVYGHYGWLGIGAVYSYRKELFRPLLAENQARHGRPFVLIETTYEGEHGATPDQIRRQAYWALLSGACGQFFGNNPIWHFDGPGIFPVKMDWKEALDAAGSRDLARLQLLFLSLPWHRLEPEENHTVVVDGYGSGVATALTARTPDGKCAVTYLPSAGEEGRVLVVDAAQFVGAVRGRWFDPSDGSVRPATAEPTGQGKQTRFRTPGERAGSGSDWVLVLEAD